MQLLASSLLLFPQLLLWLLQLLVFNLLQLLFLLLPTLLFLLIFSWLLLLWLLLFTLLLLLLVVATLALLALHTTADMLHPQVFLTLIIPASVVLDTLLTTTAQPLKDTATNRTPALAAVTMSRAASAADPALLLLLPGSTPAVAVGCLVSCPSTCIPALL